MTRATSTQLLLIAALGGAMMIGCSDGAPEEEAAPEPQIDLAAEEDAVRRVNRVWLERTRENDAAGIGELFVEEGWTLSGTDGLTEGRAAIVASLQERMDENPDQLDDWGSKGVWVAASGDLAIERGWWAQDPDGEGEAEQIEGEYITVMIKVDGQWKVLADAGAPVGGVSTDG